MPIIKPIPIETSSQDEANQVADAIKNFLRHFSAKEIITMGKSINNTVTRMTIKGYLK